MLNITQIAYQDADFSQSLEQALGWSDPYDPQLVETVRGIIGRVREQGDEALVALTNQFDQHHAGGMADLTLSQDKCQAAYEGLTPELRDALDQASGRIWAYHNRQKQSSWQYQEEDGTTLGQQITPLDRVGLYVPGGKASYPSSVLMNAIPAKVAGVKELVMAVPAPGGELSDMVLAAAFIAGVDHVFTVGGAQAVAAMAYGTQTVPRVDKIVGPGNRFVAEAKRQVFGQVGIDMIAGPSEICILCDGETDPDWIAMDLFSQAEHDEMAQSILIATSEAYIEKVQASIEKLLPTMPRAEIIRKSLNSRGLFVLVGDLAQGVEVINRIAPEHLELSVEAPENLLPSIRHAGAIFMGRYTSESLGDYCAGPNHVLPTSGSARFSSPLGVYDFQKRSSLIQCSAAGASELGVVASRLAHAEGLQAHAKSAEMRVMP